ncbi:Catenin beta-1 [Cichlidogyrus casuarinus]|uniref:Catenin beta-1 n=1 Tax=Cichlidogyrus casuarinus TaxID=1844966 RepID=A0ABD2QF71_9PLAT
MDYHGQEFRPNAGDDFLELSSMPVDKQRQTQLWQQNQYLDDSGIQSGLTSHVPSIISGGTDYLSAPNEKVGWAQRRAYDSMSVISTGDALVSSAPPSASSINFGSMEPFGDSVNMDLRGNQLQDIDSSEVAAAIPDLIKVMRENENHSVLYQAAIMIFQLSKSEAIEALIGSDEMIVEVIQTLSKTEDPDMIRFFAGTLYNISQTQKGLKAIFNANCIPCLIKLLDSNIESVLFYAITTLHNLLLHQDGAKPLVRAEGKNCLRSMCVLLRKNNVKFLTILTDCLQILAYGHAESKLIILQHGGPQELVRILYQYSYEKLLWTTARVLKVLSVCSMNKPAIIQVGGLDALGRHLISSSNSQRLTMNCLWTLRNLSDAAASVTNVSIVPGSRNSLQNLLSALIQLLTSSDPAMVACSAGILSNLTCNNCTNKLLVCQCDGIKQLLAAVASNPSRNDILEPCVCALRHLTARHDGEEAARAVLAARDKLDGLPLLTRVLHAATAAVCPELGLLPTQNQQQSPLNWGLVKAMVGLIRNLALNRELHTCMREYGLVTGLNWLLYGTLISIFSARKVSLIQRQQLSY